MNAYLILTTINDVNKNIILMDNQCHKNNISFIVIGDKKSPHNFKLKYGRYYSISDQKKLPFEYVKKCPFNHYSRKNIGYLIAIKENADLIIETDDDNLPLKNFWKIPLKKNLTDLTSEKNTFVNVYDLFLNKKQSFCWPRGYPLEQIKKNREKKIKFKKILSLNPIQQDLADLNPDVDAVYRLTQKLPITFDKRKPVALNSYNWSPFNSQNTRWFPEAFSLMYLPSTCSFRMTDIWRSYIAQRIGWEYNWKILYRESSVTQERNAHDLLNDFELEISGFLNYSLIKNKLSELNLSDDIGDNLISCYNLFIKNKLFTKSENQLLLSWLSDYEKFKS